MINTEIVIIDGKQYKRTYSDTYTIQREGVEYSEAIDPLYSGREYIETGNKLKKSDETNDEN